MIKVTNFSHTFY